MKARYCLLFISLAPILAGCTTSTSPGSAVTFGNCGHVVATTADGKHVEISVTRWQQGTCLAYYIVGQLPNEDPGPAALVLVRLPQTACSDQQEMSKNEDGTTWWGTALATDNKKCAIRYQITHDPAAEELKLCEQKVDLESAQVYLIDLTTNPVKPTAVKQSLEPLLPSHDPTAAKFNAAIDQLKDKHEIIRQLFEQPH